MKVTPVSLFSGNIIFVHTNKDDIKEKYYGATTMILLTDALSSKRTPPMEERFRYSKLTISNHKYKSRRKTFK